MLLRRPDRQQGELRVRVIVLSAALRLLPGLKLEHRQTLQLGRQIASGGGTRGRRGIGRHLVRRAGQRHLGIAQAGEVQRRQRLQARHQLFLFPGSEQGAGIRPAARAGLAGDQAHGHPTDQLPIARFAQTIEEQDGQGQDVGVGQAGRRAADSLHGLPHRGIVGRHVAFQQGQAGQGDGARVSAMAPKRRLRAWVRIGGQALFQESDAAIRCFDRPWPAAPASRCWRVGGPACSAAASVAARSERAEAPAASRSRRPPRPAPVAPGGRLPGPGRRPERPRPERRRGRRLAAGARGPLQAGSPGGC